MSKRATVEGSEYAASRDLKAHSERLESMIPVYRRELADAVDPGAQRAALRKVEDAEVDLIETRKRMAKRRR